MKARRILIKFIGIILIYFGGYNNGMIEGALLSILGIGIIVLSDDANCVTSESGGKDGS